MGKRLNRFSSIIIKKENDLDIKAVWFGFTVSLGVWFIAMVLGLIWLAIKGEGFFWYSIYIYIMGILGVFAGGIAAGTRTAVKGWLHGLWVGIILGIIGAIINLELLPYTYTWAGLGRQVFLWVLWGLTGGQLGYHYKNRTAYTKSTKRLRGF